MPNMTNTLDTMEPAKIKNYCGDDMNHLSFYMYRTANQLNIPQLKNCTRFIEKHNTWNGKMVYMRIVDMTTYFELFGFKTITTPTTTTFSRNGINIRVNLTTTRKIYPEFDAQNLEYENEIYAILTTAKIE